MTGDGLPGPPGDGPGGVRRTPLGAGEAEERLGRAGWTAALVSDGATKAAFLGTVADVLHFPAYFGHNLDALWDCLNELPRPTALVWEGWQHMAVETPDDWAGVVDVLSERARADGTPFAVVLVEGARP